MDTYHIYEGTYGIISLVIRIAVGIVFLVGCFKVRTLSVGKRKFFIQKYMKFGSIYLFAWPSAVILS